MFSLARLRPIPLLLVCAALAGCGARAAGSVVVPTAASVPAWSSLHLLADPRTASGPSTARIGDADVVPVTTAPAPVLPAVVTDNQGTRVTVRSDERILALDLYGTLAATVYGLGLGDHLVGRDQSTGFPAAQHLPLVTSNAHQLSAEAILALHPTVLLTDTTLGPWDVVLQIRAAGIPVVVVDSHRSIDNVGALVAQVAAGLGVVASGKALSIRLSQEIKAERARIDAIAPKSVADRPRILFLYVRGQAGTYYIFGKGSGADTLIDALDGVDVATEARIYGFSPLNAEALAKAKPDVILMMTSGLQSVGGVAGALKLPGVAETPAGQRHRIVDMSDYEVLSFGPLTASVLDALARAIYGSSGRAS